ncbi:MAG: SIR2 family protein [Syntrophales bacterium]
MLDGNDLQTFYFLRELCDLAQSDKKPILFWVGAGASSWCGYPKWEELSDIIAREFSKYEIKYRNNQALLVQLLSDGEYPEFFQECKNINSKRYYTILAKCVTSSRSTSPVYNRFIDDLLFIKPLYIVTTNIDELLEKNLPGIETTQRSDLQRCIDLLNTKRSFVCKIHGSISNIESVIMTTDDYGGLLSDETYKELMRHIFNDCIVVFIGYSFGDRYVLELLSHSAELKNIFGDGPHFVVSSKAISDIPASLKVIRYLPEPHTDHRSTIQIVEEIISARSTSPNKEKDYEFIKPKNIVSAHLLSDIYPPGTWKTYGTLNIEGDEGKTRIVTIGHGLSESELPLNMSTAMHDLIVGLVCFDKVYAPMSSHGRAHILLGDDFFRDLVENDCLQFIQWESWPAIIYPDSSAITGGKLYEFTICDADKQKLAIQEILRNQIHPFPGQEKKADEIIKLIERKTVSINELDEPNIPRMVMGLLLRPSIRKLLGISDGTSLISLPQWNKFPVLRLANIVKIGIACQNLGIASAKLEFGMESLAGAAFSISAGVEAVDNVASYVLSGTYNSNIAEFVTNNPTAMRAILAFRDSPEGMSLRKEIFHQLSSGPDKEFAMSVNAGLKKAIPSTTLQRARDQFMGLLLANNPTNNMTPAIWNYQNYTDDVLSLWRRRSYQELKDYCHRNGIGEYDLCPCGSGDKLHFCCDKALK